MKTYQNVTKDNQLGHKPGEIFEADENDLRVQRLEKRRAIEATDASVPTPVTEEEVTAQDAEGVGDHDDESTGDDPVGDE